MGLFSEADMAEFGALAGDLALKDDCQIMREQKTSDGYGSTSSTWQTVATVKAAALPPGSKETQIQAYSSRMDAKTVQPVLLPYGTDVRLADKLVIKGKELIVQFVVQPQSYEVLVTVLASIG